MVRYFGFVLLGSLFFICHLAISQPTISISTPDNGDSDVSLRLDEIVITFEAGISQPIMGEAPTDNTVTIVPEVNFSISFDPNIPTELRLQLTGNLVPEETYTVSFNEISDAADPALISSPSFTFDTGSGVAVNNVVTSNICIGDPAGKAISPIVINENLADNFYNSGDGLEHSLRLDLPTGFIFVNTGSATFAETGTDASGTPTIATANNDKSLIINYELCNGATCTANTAVSDVLTISGVYVAATGSGLVAGTTYEIIRSDGTGTQNDAVMPGLPPSIDGSSTVFARLQVAESPAINLTNLGTGQAITDEIVLCPNGDDFAINAEIEDPTNAVTFFLSKTQEASGFVELGLDTLQIINEALISTILFASEDVVYPVYLKASVSGSLCDGFSPLISITKDDGTSTPNATFSTNFPAENTTVTPGVSQDEFIVAVDNPGGILNIYCRGACLT